MRRIDELKLELVDTIRHSEEFREYRRLQAEIDKLPDLKRQVDEFRRQNYEIQNSPDVSDMFIATEELNKRYADMRKQDIVNRYLNAEIVYCSYIRDIYMTIADAVQFELDFLD